MKPHLEEADFALLGPCAVRLRYDDVEIDVELLTSDELWRMASAALVWANKVRESFDGG